MASLIFTWMPTFAIGPINWQLEFDQGVTEFYVDTKFVIRSLNWQLEIRHGVTDFYVDANLCHRTN
jgi:hypothetical protein